MARALLCFAVATLLALANVALQPDVGAQAATDLQLTARNAILIDAETGAILYESDADARVAPASLTKLFTAFYAIESTPLHRSMTVAESDLVGEASAGLWAGAELPFEALLHGMLLPSGNDAATTIASNLGGNGAAEGPQAVATFVTGLNGRLAELGLANTQLVNPHGLDEPGHFSSARDISALTLYALRNEPQFVSAIGTSDFQFADLTWHNSNRLLGEYDGLVGGKTGVTDNAGYCLMEVAQRGGRTLIAVILGSTADDWYYDAATLLDYGFASVVAAPELGRIAFPSEQPEVVAASTTAFEVTQLNNGRQVVTPAVAVADPLWRSVKWPLLAGLAGLMLLVCCAQYHAWQRLKVRRRRPRPQLAALGTERFDLVDLRSDIPRPRPSHYSAALGTSPGD
jgi:D-alanyl-D-alanine carboxypeptidase (penicillin-binding protein 5/6)